MAPHPSMKLAFGLPLSILALLSCGARGDVLGVGGAGAEGGVSGSSSSTLASASSSTSSSSASTSSSTASSSTGAGGDGGAGGVSSSSSSSSSSSGTGGAPPVCTPGETLPCYGGPPGTESIGTCKEGVRTCVPDGSAFGPCVGEIVPSSDSCATAEDEDCDGQSPSCPPAYLRLFGGNARLIDMSVDVAGHAFVLGVFDGPLDLGGGATLSPIGEIDLFAMHLDGDGEVVWVKQFPIAGSSLASYGTIVPRVDGVFISGAVDGAIDLGNGPVSGDGGFVAKLDLNGHPQWVYRTGDFVQKIDVDPAGNVLVAGQANCYIPEIGACPPWSTSRLFKLSPQGTLIWEQTLSTSSELFPFDIAVDAQGSAIVVGWLLGPVDIGTGMLEAAPDALFVGKIDAAGTALWARAFHDPDYVGSTQFALSFHMKPISAGGGGYIGPVTNGGFSVAIANNGDALIAGTVGGSIDFGGGALFTNSPGLGIVRLGPDGEHVFSRVLGGPVVLMPPAIASGPNGEIGIAAFSKFLGLPYPDPGLDFGAGKLPYGLALAEFDSSGGYVTAKSLSTFSMGGFCGLAIAAGGTYLAATAGSPITLDPTKPPLTGFFVTRMIP